jgi:twitching motility protein PilT
VSLHDILSQAVDLGASDVHLKFGQPPVVRIDGDLAPLEGHGNFSSEALEDILNTVGASAPRRVRLFQETGEMDTAYQLPDLPRFRVNAFRQRGDISFAFRVIPAQIPDFRGLGLPPGVEALSEEHRGLVLVTGATGSGKTTSLAAMLGHINRTR